VTNKICRPLQYKEYSATAAWSQASAASVKAGISISRCAGIFWRFVVGEKRIATRHATQVLESKKEIVPSNNRPLRLLHTTCQSTGTVQAQSNPANVAFLQYVLSRQTRLFPGREKVYLRKSILFTAHNLSLRFCRVSVLPPRSQWHAQQSQQNYLSKKLPQGALCNKPGTMNISYA